MKTTFEFSAGGIVFRKNTGKIEVLISQHSSHHGWVFPKGHIGDTKKDETKEEAALREVKEETGITAKILQALSPIEYWYFFEGEKRHKTVYYFLMEYVSGNINDHDFEMENVEWLPISNIKERLTYQGDRKAFLEARELIMKRL